MSWWNVSKQGNKSFLWQRQDCCLPDLLPPFLWEHGWMTLEFWTIESEWKGSSHFQAGIVETYHVTLHVGSSTCARSAESSREVGTLGGGRIQSGRSLSRVDYSSSLVLSYYVNKFVGCCFSSGASTDQHNALHLTSENSNLQKGFVFLILFDTYNNPTRQIISLLYL